MVNVWGRLYCEGVGSFLYKKNRGFCQVWLWFCVGVIDPADGYKNWGRVCIKTGGGIVNIFDFLTEFQISMKQVYFPRKMFTRVNIWKMSPSLKLCTLVNIFLDNQLLMFWARKVYISEKNDYKFFLVTNVNIFLKNQFFKCLQFRKKSVYICQYFWEKQLRSV